MKGPTISTRPPAKRSLADTTLLLTPKGRINLYINVDYGRDNHVASRGYDTWYGLAGAAHIRITRRIALSPRVENPGRHVCLRPLTAKPEF